MTGKLSFRFYFIFTVQSLNLKSHTWLVSPIIHSASLVLAHPEEIPTSPDVNPVPATYPHFPGLIPELLKDTKCHLISRIKHLPWVQMYVALSFVPWIVPSPESSFTKVDNVKEERGKYTKSPLFSPPSPRKMYHLTQELYHHGTLVTPQAWISVSHQPP